MNILKYRWFNNLDDFINWQIENKPKITNVLPFPKTMNGNGENDEINLEISTTIFVLYFED